MSVINDDQSDLTFDACPDYPVDDEDNEKLPPNNENQDTNKEQTFKSEKIKKSSQKTAYATVINISNSNGIHIGSNYNIVINKKEKQQTSKESDSTLSNRIKKLFEMNSQLSKEQIMFLSKHIGNGWRDTARSLGYSNGQIDQIYQDNVHSGQKEVIYQFLVDWVQDKVDKATIAHIASSLWNNNEKEAVSRLADFLERK